VAWVSGCWRREEIARSLGYKRIWLYTNQRFTENVRLYLRLGYRVDRMEDVGGGKIRVDMSKSLGSTSALNDL
jgi:hypothetical protein